MGQIILAIIVILVISYLGRKGEVNIWKKNLNPKDKDYENKIKKINEIEAFDNKTKKQLDLAASKLKKYLNNEEEDEDTFNDKKKDKKDEIK